MTRAEIQQQIVQALASVAPEVDPASISSDVPLRDQVDLDSMDFLRFVVEIHTRLGVDIPESDYPRLARVPDAVEYLVARLTH